MAEAKKAATKSKIKDQPDIEDSLVKPEVEQVTAAKSTAKAGKRSAKSVKQAEEKAEKQSRLEANEPLTDKKPAKVIQPTRSRLERQGKKFREAAKLIEKGKAYSLNEAIDLAIKTSPVKFDASLEMHINLAVDPRQADQNIRSTLVLPAGTGKTIKVAVFADDKAEGADLAGTESIIKKLDKGEIDFDILIATPATMPKLGKYARLLGPRGLMPNPKSGTVTTDINKAVSEAKAGRVEYRVDSTGIVHLSVGKVSFGVAKLQENVDAVIASIRGNKPASVKGNFIKSVHLATTMGPSILVTL